MIEFGKSYIVDGKAFATLEEAQIYDIRKLFETDPDGNVSPETMVKHKDELINILTTTAKSRPRARKANGGKKMRKKAAQAVIARAGEALNET